MFGNAPRALWQKWTEVDDKGRIPLACRCLLIQTDKYNILCETGIGAFFEPKRAERFGVESPSEHKLIKHLEEYGLHEEDIHFVILSHLHFDHAGGLLPTYENKENRQDLLFPKAQYIVGQEAWERALKPHFRDQASFIPELNQKLQESGRLIIVKENSPPDELKDVVEFFTSDGHTPGQLHTIVKGNKKSVVFAGDLIPGAAWVHLPITMGYDRYPERLIEEKQSLYERFSQQDWSVFFTHDDKHAMAQIRKNEKGKFAPVDLVGNFKDLEI